MIRSAVFWLVVLPILGSAALAQGGEPGLPPPIVPLGFGVNIHFTDPVPGESDRFAQPGWRLARMDLAWAAVEQTAGRYDFAAYDRLVAHLARVGARPLLIFDYGNRLHDGGRAPYTDAGRAAFARFAAAAAAHFRGKGVLWEVWNEPNLAQFWKPDPDAGAYARLAVATARAVRAADPEAVILAPGSSGFPWPFFETTFRAGLLESIDAVSVHPYRDRPPEFAAEDFGRLRALIARHAPPGRAGLPIVSSEWGYSTATGGVSETTQAQYLARMWLANLAAGVNLSIFYDWRDDGDDPHEREHRFGTVRRDLMPKPSFDAARTLITALDGFTFRHRLRSTGPDDWRLLFQRDDTDALALVTWRADPTAAEADRAPRVRQVAPGSIEFGGLRRLASVRYVAGALAEGSGLEAALEVTVLNPEPDPARVEIVPGGPGTAALTLALPPGRSEHRRVPLPPSALRSEHREVPIALRWNGELLPAVAPLNLWRIDPLMLTVAPRGEELEAALANPSGTAFAGRLAVVSGGREAATRDMHLPAGTDRGVVRLPRPAATYQLVLKDHAGAVLARQGPRRDEPMVGFPAQAGGEPGFHLVLYVDNRPRSPTPLAVVATEPGSPAPVALVVPYDFDRGWCYASVTPTRPTPIPVGARALTMWVRNGTADDHLRSRFRDATGQTFQMDLGRLGGPGWRPVQVPLDGSSPGNHWGGANDGVPHPPLAWDALILIDSAQRDISHRGEVWIAAPFYVLGE